MRRGSGHSRSRRGRGGGRGGSRGSGRSGGLRSGRQLWLLWQRFRLAIVLEVAHVTQLPDQGWHLLQEDIDCAGFHPFFIVVALAASLL